MQHLILAVSTGVLLWGVAQRLNARDVMPSAEPDRQPPRAQPAPRTTAAPLSPLAFESTLPVAVSTDAGHHAQVRDRYIAARFPGVGTTSAALVDTERVVTAARLLFEEGRHEDAQELLLLAIRQSQSPRPLELARLEITFLQADADRYVALARAFEVAYPASREWDDVARLGRALVPAEPLFATGLGERAHEHYGPWPDTPNWIRASWDLTPEVLASEFHQAMRRNLDQGDAT